jgi:hypothetical protein
MRKHVLITALLLCSLTAIAPALGFEGFSVGFTEAWTGNGYVTPEFEVTGSEETPIDPFVRLGVRFGLLDGFIAENAVLSIMPALELGVRPYLLYASGIVVPTQIETGTGAEGNTLGQGSARVLTIRVPIPVAYELRFARGGAFFFTLSPTLVARVRVGQIWPGDADLSGMYTYFYERMRFLMPEVELGYRFRVSDWLESTIRATYGVSTLDLFDDTLPWYDKTRVGLGVSVGFTPPFEGLFRDREETQRLPRGVDPDPEVPGPGE